MHIRMHAKVGVEQGVEVVVVVVALQGESNWGEKVTRSSETVNWTQCDER